MIKYMNKHHGNEFLFMYSTPSNYIDALKEKDIKWPTKYDDMFPYEDKHDTFWTGYYSSRPNDKAFIRRASSYFRSSSQLYSQKVVD